MAPSTIGIIFLLIFLVMIFIGVPVCASMMIAGCVGCMFLLPRPSAAMSILSDSFVKTFTGYTMSVAPMFMLMGEIASESGIGTNLFSSCKTIFGRVRGGLACAVQVACAVFGAICGSAPATEALMSRIAYPEMKRHGYSDEISTGCIGAAASLASLIPPSLVLITFGVAAEESIGQLFMGGIMVGIILTILFIITIQIWCAINPKHGPGGEKTTIKEKLIAIRKGSIIEIVVVFGLSMVGMFAGWFTPTEAGAIGVVLMLLVVIFTKRFSFKMLLSAMEHTIVMSGMLYCLMAAAQVFGRLFTLARIADILKSFVLSLSVPGPVLVLVLGVIFLLLGCFIDTLPVMLVTMPIFLPILRTYGYSGIWYGVFNVLVAGLGAITPPVGMGCYIISGITGAPLQKVFKGSIPFVIPFMAMILIMAIVPQTATWLPDLIYHR